MIGNAEPFEVPEGWVLMLDTQVPKGWEYSYGPGMTGQFGPGPSTNPCLCMARRVPFTVQIPVELAEAIDAAGTFADHDGVNPLNPDQWDQLVVLVRLAMLDAS